ncbi:MAG: UvrB/UvrC motif-containing protein [Verrucomicrobia bacterium]|nr:UvrB/UvrC motif-containing protein [Verrucomicrobiota bacterium]
MLCMVCKQREAKVHLTQMLEGKTKKVDLCDECAKAKGVDDPAGFSLADLLMGLGAANELAQSMTEAGEARCPRCGLTQADFKKTGRLGCDQCYETFRESLSSLLKNMHKGTKHRGKVPGGSPASPATDDRLMKLQQDLLAAIKAENYEEAARLRDAIKALKQDSANAMA